MNEEAERMMAQGRAFVEQGKMEKAIPCFDRAITLEPDDHEAYMCRGALRLLAGEVKGALEDFNNALRLHGSGEYIMFLNRAYAHLALHHWAEAEADASKGLELIGDDESLFYYHCDGLISRATARRELDKLEEALADYNAALEIRPDAINGLLSRAALYAGKEDWDAAFADVNRAKKAVPQSPLGYYYAACLYAKQHNNRMAIRELRRAAVLDPKIVVQAANDDDLTPMLDDPEVADDLRAIFNTADPNVKAKPFMAA